MVDKNLIKILERTQLALVECITMLLSIEEASQTLKKPAKNKVITKPLPKKSGVKMKKPIKTKPLKKSLKKSTKPLKKLVNKVLTKSTKISSSYALSKSYDSALPSVVWGVCNF